ncbi:hypothetical protein KIL84_013080, partial [Mauremys mutica]
APRLAAARTDFTGGNANETSKNGNSTTAVLLSKLKIQQDQKPKNQHMKEELDSN